MDLSTSYLGFKLPHPLMPGASPLVDDLDTVKRLEDAGAAAIVMHSLFEEQIAREQVTTFLHTEMHGESFAEALSYFPSPDRFALGPEEYLRHVTRLKATVRVPVIASLNGTTLGGWLDYARLIQQAGADALELNVYTLPTDPEESGDTLEKRAEAMLREVKSHLHIPVAVKLSPFYASLPHFARRLERAGADGLVLFNRFYQPDIDIEDVQVVRAVASLPLGRTPPAPALARHPVGGKRDLVRRQRRRTLRRGRDQGGDGRGARRPDGVLAPAERARPPQDRAGRDGRVAGRPPVRLARADAGEYEPARLPRPQRLRARQLHVDPAELAGAVTPGVVLVGNPNVGKSALFGALTGTYVTVSNYPGTTVEVTSGAVLVSGRKLSVIDTPGVGSFIPSSQDERVTRDILLSGPSEAVVAVGDAKNLERTLLLALQLAEMKVPLVLCLNMMDEAASRGIGADLDVLAKRLGVEVVAHSRRAA